MKPALNQKSKSLSEELTDWGLNLLQVFAIDIDDCEFFFVDPLKYFVKRLSHFLLEI